jgi:hypothetical protein
VATAPDGSPVELHALLPERGPADGFVLERSRELLACAAAAPERP